MLRKPLLILFCLLFVFYFNIHTVEANTRENFSVEDYRQELINRLLLLIEELKKQIATQQQTNKVVEEKKPKDTIKDNRFVHIKNIDQNTLPVNFTLSANSGDRIEFTWSTSGMRDCQFQSNDGTNTSGFDIEGYRVIGAPAKAGVYDYSVSCYNSENTYLYTPLKLVVKSLSSSMVDMHLELEDLETGRKVDEGILEVAKGSTVSINWKADEFNECELEHSALGDPISTETEGTILTTLLARPGAVVNITLRCERDMPGPDLKIYKSIDIKTEDKDGRYKDLG